MLHRTNTLTFPLTYLKLLLVLLIWNGLSTQILAQTTKKYNNNGMMKKPKTKQIKSKQIEEWIQVGRAVLRNDIRPEYMEGL